MSWHVVSESEARVSAVAGARHGPGAGALGAVRPAGVRHAVWEDSTVTACGRSVHEFFNWPHVAFNAGRPQLDEDHCPACTSLLSATH